MDLQNGNRYKPNISCIKRAYIGLENKIVSEKNSAIPFLLKSKYGVYGDFGLVILSDAPCMATVWYLNKYFS